MEEESDDAASQVMLLPSPRWKISSFACPVPAGATMETMTAFAEEDDDDQELAVPVRPRAMVQNASSMEGMGIVGTITHLPNAYLIWFGWGQLQAAATATTGQAGQQPLSSSSPNTKPNAPRLGVNHSHMLGPPGTRVAATTHMGQWLVAMPPQPHLKGAYFSAKESTTSKLIGGDDQDDTIARQMASRLSMKTQRPVFVSCHLSASHLQSMALDADLLHQRAAALAEKEVWRLLQQEQ